MAMTEAIRHDLLGEIIPHKGQEGATITETGLLKTKKGLIIQPSTMGNGDDTKTGALAELTEAEKAAYHVEDAPSVQQPQTVPVYPGIKPRRGRRPSQQQKIEQAPVKKSITLTVLDNALGEMPFSYAHAYHDPSGTLILGLEEHSFVPKKAQYTDEGVKGSVVFKEYPGQVFVFAGYEFKDNSGVRNIIMMQVPDTNEETENDGQEIE